MSGSRYDGLDPSAAEFLLDGNAGQTAREAQLAELLAAASGPAAADELAGERAALAAFAESRRHRAGDARRFRSLLAKLVASKTAAVVLVGSVAAGGAFAAGGGVPIPFNGPSRGGGDVPPPSPATVSPHTATPEPSDEPDNGTVTEEPDLLDQTPSLAPTTPPTESPTPGGPTGSPTEPVGDPSSSPRPTDHPTSAPGRGEDPITGPEDPDTSAKDRPTAGPPDSSGSNAADGRRGPGRHN